MSENTKAQLTVCSRFQTHQCVSHARSFTVDFVDHVISIRVPEERVSQNVCHKDGNEAASANDDALPQRSQPEDCRAGVRTGSV